MTAAEQLRALVKEATPGPWWANRVGATAGQTIRNQTNQPVARLLPDDRDSLGVPGDEGALRARVAIQKTEADARLIALAPQLAELVADMGEALKETSDWLEMSPTNGYGRDLIPIKQADAVLARLGALFSEAVT